MNETETKGPTIFDHVSQGRDCSALFLLLLGLFDFVLLWGSDFKLTAIF